MVNRIWVTQGNCNSGVEGGLWVGNHRIRCFGRRLFKTISYGGSLAEKSHFHIHVYVNYRIKHHKINRKGILLSKFTIESAEHLLPSNCCRRLPMSGRIQQPEPLAQRRAVEEKVFSFHSHANAVRCCCSEATVNNKSSSYSQNRGWGVC